MTIYLEKAQVVKINLATIQKHGGNFNPPNNYLHEENLDYLIDAVSAEMFGEPMYPKISEKAALYCFNIIGKHIFSDGNKRTGLAAALMFLNLNNFDISENITNEILTTFILNIAKGNSSLDECKAWFETNIVKL
jgi:death on curing protein